MKVKKITVSYKETHSFGRYNNISPSVIYEAELGEEDSLLGVTMDLMVAAEVHVRQSIDDALERNGHSPVYDVDDLFQVLVSHERRVVVLGGVGMSNVYPVDFFPQGSQMRQDTATKLATSHSMHTGYEFSGSPTGPEHFSPLEKPDIPTADEDEIPF